MLFVIQQVEGPEIRENGRLPTLLYATDTGPFPADTWSFLGELGREGIHFSATLLDATMGVGKEGYRSPHHLTLEEMIDHQRQLAQQGLLHEPCHCLAHHFSHFLCPSHDELEEMLAPHGVQPTYDGLMLQL